MTQTPDEIAGAVARALYANDRAARSLGIHVVEVGAGRSVLRMAVRTQMTNGYDIGHGGITFTLADTAMAYASGSFNRTAVASMAQISFLKPTYAGDILTATAEETAAAGRTGVYDIDVRNQKGEQVAVFRGQTQTIKGKVIEDLPVTRER
ncbi:MAG: hydroxyphenylacetyl-CoA thioesterase PaaI [Minwuia sp.]|uniref:hydroxyphenylacetyl-CoA thioesterase PaaI n=1 Tax=Minwuia sp. TaxID=2493630 RepID=UPI003A8ADE58